MTTVVSGSAVGSDSGNPSSTIPSSGGNGGGGGTPRGNKQDFSNLLLSDPGYPVPPPPERTMQGPKFSKYAEAFFGALTTYPDVMNPAALAASKSARAAQASARAAVQTAGASNLWISGHTYSRSETAISTINFQTYRRKNIGSGTLDPSLDATNWAILNLSSNALIAFAYLGGG